MSSRRRGGFLTSAAIHGFLVAMLMTPAAPQPSRPQTTSILDVVQVDADALAGVTDQTFDFDVAKILSRGGSLFPFTQGALLHTKITAHLQTRSRDSSTQALVVEPSLAQPPLELTKKRVNLNRGRCPCLTTPRAIWVTDAICA